ncbi:hypothetical protein V492_06982 [Pseudogymnoascus sp. VKM F-4246]|nr:hypothetical protein V492_06982 [Pseudogymnoascus sp. VKM F-4246]
MFKAFRATSSLFRLNRVPLSVHARIKRDGAAASVQGVRLKKAPMSRRYMLGSAIGVLLTYNVFTTIVFAPLDRLADEVEKEGRGILDNETPEDLEGGLFLPFPGTIKQIPQSPYRGSDPEWKEYVKFSKDLALITKVRAELAEITRKSIENVKGGKGARILKHWLDVNYPYGPPPTFVHSGIEITDDFISWSTVPIDQETVLRIHQALFPVAVAKATWKFVQVLFSQDPEEKTRSIMRAHYKLPDPAEAKKTLRALGASDKNITEDRVTQARVPGFGGITTQAGNYNNKQSGPTGEKTLRIQSDAASDAKNNENQRGSEQPERRSIKDSELYKMMARRSAHALFTFRFTNTANWKQVKVIPRGSIVVSGWVELETQLDFVTVEVIGSRRGKTTMENEGFEFANGKAWDGHSGRSAAFARRFDNWRFVQERTITVYNQQGTEERKALLMGDYLTSRPQYCNFWSGQATGWTPTFPIFPIRSPTPPPHCVIDDGYMLQHHVQRQFGVAIHTVKEHTERHCQNNLACQNYSVYLKKMALAPKFSGQLFSSLSHAPKVHTLELYLDYVCPFSKKQFETIYEKVFPIIKSKYTGRINVVFRQQVQPWHPSSTLVHEAGVAALRLDPATFWAYSVVLFKHQTEFFDVNVVNETRNQTYRRLAKLYGALGASGPGTHQADEEKLYELLAVGDKAGEGGALNIGNKVTDDLKLLIKLGRQTGIHVSPTVLWDGLVDNSISSSWTPEQWDKFFEEKLHK